LLLIHYNELPTFLIQGVSCLTDNRRPDALPAMCRTPRLGEF